MYELYVKEGCVFSRRLEIALRQLKIEPEVRVIQNTREDLVELKIKTDGLTALPQLFQDGKCIDLSSVVSHAGYDSAKLGGLLGISNKLAA